MAKAVNNSFLVFVCCCLQLGCLAIFCCKDYWDTCDDAGPPTRPQAAFTGTPPTMELCTIGENNAVVLLWLCFGILNHFEQGLSFCFQLHILCF